jgi:hypothetical protein
MHQHCLTLIIRMMPHGDGTRAHASRHIGKKPIAHLARCLFKRRAPLLRYRCYVYCLDGTRQSPIQRQQCNKDHIFICLCTAQTVVEVSDVQ